MPEQNIAGRPDLCVSAVDHEEITETVRTVISTLHGNLSTTDLKLFGELENLAAFIQQAKAEIAALIPQQIKDEHIPSATDELEAISEATEEATGRILGAAETIESLAPSVPEATRETLRRSVTEIYEACNFQDVTGQRINKVIHTLQHIEERIEGLIAAFGPEVADIKAKNTAARDEAATDANLLNGPQLPEDANSQDDIDALLASFD
jgi:chemotaxis protein CheZ